MSQTNDSKTDLPNFDALWDYSQPEETEVKFRQLLPVAESSGNAAYHAELLTQLARTMGMQREFEKAHSILDSVEAMLTDAMPVGRIRYALERGRVYNSSKEKENAIPLFKQALEIAEQHDEDYYAVDAAHMLGIATPPKEQLAWNRRAMKMAEETKDARAKKWLGALYNNIGWTYHDLGRYEEALEVFEKGLRWREERNDSQGTFIAKWTIARTHRSLDRIDDAINLLNELRRQMEAGDAEKDGYVYEELGECHLIRKDTAMYQKFFGQAYALLKEDGWLQANESERLERMERLSR